MWLIFVYFVSVPLLVAGLMLASYVLGQRRGDRATGVVLDLVCWRASRAPTAAAQNR